MDSKDQSSQCTNYPTEEFISYADCDMKFVRSNLPEGMLPFWATDNISEASINYTTNDIENSFWAQGK